MYPRTSEFDTAYKNSHTVVTACEIYSATGTYIQDLDIIDGNITIDDDQENRRTATLQVTDPYGDLVPGELGDLLAPRTNEIKLYRGIKFPDGTSELLPCGVFGIVGAAIDDSGQGLHMGLDLADRAYDADVHKFTTETQIAEGTPVHDAVQQLVAMGRTSTVFDIQPITGLTPVLSYKTGDSPWNAAFNLADRAGAEVFFDPDGICVIRPLPNFSTVEPVWTFEEGEDATILYVNKRITAEGFFNHIIVIGDSPNNSIPVRAEAYDDGLNSPTSIHGQQGDVVKVIRDDKIADIGTASALAEAELQKSVGLGELVRFNALVHPAVEIYDVIALKRLDSKLDGNYVMDKITVPMTLDRPMDVSCRRKLI